MKTILIAAAMALTTFTASANKETRGATATRVSSTVKFAFEKEFGKIDNVNWSTTNNYLFRANFTNQEEKVSAFFDKDGTYIATTIQVPVENIPARLKTAVLQREIDGVITESFEFLSDGDRAFYINVYNNGKEKLYKGYENGYVHRVIL